MFHSILEEITFGDRIIENIVYLDNWYCFYAIENEFYFAPVQLFIHFYNLDAHPDLTLCEEYQTALVSQDKNKLVELVGKDRPYTELTPFIYCYCDGTYNLHEAHSVDKFLGCYKIDNIDLMDKNKWKALIDDDHFLEDLAEFEKKRKDSIIKP